MATRIKVCGLKDAATAQCALELGADYLGLVLTPSQRQISRDAAQRIMEQVPGGRFVLVGRDVEDGELEGWLATAAQGVQIHGTAPSGWIQRAQRAGKMAIATTLRQDADVVLLDNPEPGSGQARDWQVPPFTRPIWLAGGLNPDNVRQVVAALRPAGVDVSSGVEIGGEKDWGLIQRFIEEVRRGDKAST